MWSHAGIASTYRMENKKSFFCGEGALLDSLSKKELNNAGHRKQGMQSELRVLIFGSSTSRGKFSILKSCDFWLSPLLYPSFPDPELLMPMKCLKLLLLLQRQTAMILRLLGLWVRAE